MDPNANLMEQERILERLDVLAERRLVAEAPALYDVLKALVRQVEISNAVDDHGHELRHLKALADAQAVLARVEGRPVCEANARLIVEAPAMLELLRRRVQPFCPVSVQDDIRALLARVEGTNVVE